jgi:hypothetical protein
MPLCFHQQREFAAEGCSFSTMTSYTQHLKLWLTYAGDVDVAAITAPDVRAYLAYLRTEYQPKRLSRNHRRPMACKSP